MVAEGMEGPNYRSLSIFLVLSRFGDDRLSHDLSQSIIGAKGFHVRVRDGIEWITLAIATKSTQYHFYKRRVE